MDPTSRLLHPLILLRWTCKGLWRFIALRRQAKRGLRMWTTEQRQRLGLENAILKQEGFDQFTVYWDKQNDTYYASGVTPSSSGRNYGLHISIPSGFPDERPPMYLTEPFPLLLANGNRVS